MPCKPPYFESRLPRHLHLPKQMTGPHWAIFVLVSKRFSHGDRPRLPEGRFQNSVQLQMLGNFGRTPFSKVQMGSKFGFEQKRRSQRCMI